MADAPTPAATAAPASKPRDYTPPLPKQVRDQMAQAEQIRADIATVNAPAGDAPSSAPEGTSPQPAAPEGAQPAADDETWEQRARSTAGRLADALKANQAISERMQALEREVTTLKTKPVATEAPAEPRPKPKLVTPDEERDYGTDFLQVVGKRAKEEFAPEFDELAERLKRIEGRIDSVGQVIEKTQVNDVYGTLAGQVPNWRDINRSAEFKQWLAHPDAYSGRRRLDMLQEAFNGHDSPRVVAFFKGFLTEAAGLPQGSQALVPSAPQAQPNGNGSGRPTLEELAAPGRARSGPQELPPDKPVYTSAWIAQFTRDKLRGVYRGREADADAIEADIYRAQHEGRIH